MFLRASYAILLMVEMGYSCVEQRDSCISSGKEPLTEFAMETAGTSAQTKATTTTKGRSRNYCSRLRMIELAEPFRVDEERCVAGK
jgi:hypothetical protein